MIWNTLAYYRKQKPGAGAVLLSGGVIPYGRFVGDIARVTAALRGQVPAGTRRIAIGVGSNYLHWLCILALMRLRITSASMSREYGAELFSPDAVILDQAVDSPIPVIVADPAWLREPIRAEELAISDAPEPFPVRVTGSSGTTGRPKRTLFQSDLSFRRITQIGVDLGIGPDSRTAVMMGLASVGGFQLPLATWLRGGMVVLAQDPLFSPSVTGEQRPNILMASTGMFESLMNRVAADGPAFPETRFLIGGSSVNPTILTRGRRRLSSHVEILYGSTEASMVSLTSEDETIAYSVGFPLPYLTVEVVDDAGKPVAAGETGVLRTRSAFSVSDYDGDAEATAEAFKDGWFYPGDLAALTPEGRLLIVGRVSEVFNVGGRKLSPSLVEETVLACPGVLEAGSCMIRAGEVGQAVAIGVTTDEAYRREAVIEAIQARLGGVRFLLAEVSEIPRNEMGKIRRTRLGEQIAALDAAAVEATSN